MRIINVQHDIEFIIPCNKCCHKKICCLKPNINRIHKLFRYALDEYGDSLKTKGSIGFKCKFFRKETVSLMAKTIGRI